MLYIISFKKKNFKFLELIEIFYDWDFNIINKQSYVVNLSAFASNSTCQLNVSRHYSDSFGMNRAQISVFE